MTALAARPQLVPPANRRSFGPPTQLSDALDDAVALGVGIEGHRRAERHREVAAILDRIDDDDLACAGDARGLHRTEADRSGTEDDDVGTGLESACRRARRRNLMPAGRRGASVARPAGQ